MSKRPKRPQYAAEFIKQETDATKRAFDLLQKMDPQPRDINVANVTNRGATIMQGYAGQMLDLPRGVAGRPAGLDAFLIVGIDFEVPYGHSFDRRLDTRAKFMFNLAIGRSAADVTVERYERPQVTTQGFHEGGEIEVKGIKAPAMMRMFTPGQKFELAYDAQIDTMARNPAEQRKQQEFIGWLEVMESVVG